MKSSQEKIRRKRSSPPREKMIRSMIAGLSHSFNQPLTSILGFADWLLKKGELRSEDQKTIEKIHQEARRMNQMIQEFGRGSTLRTVPYVGKEKMVEVQTVFSKKLAWKKPKEKISAAEWGWVSDIETFFWLMEKTRKAWLPNLQLTFWTFEEETKKFVELGRNRENPKNLKLWMEVLQGQQPKRISSSSVHLLFPIVGFRYQHGILEVQNRKKKKLSPQEEMGLHWLLPLLSLALSSLRSRKESDRLRTFLVQIFHDASTMVFVLDVEGKILILNRAASSSLEISRPYHQNLSFFDLAVSSEDEKKFRQELKKCQTVESSLPFLSQLRSTHRPPIRARIQISPMPETENKLERILVMAEPWTDTREKENRMTHVDRLASLGQMAAEIAHEINNPLTVITTYSEDLLRRAEKGLLRDEIGLARMQQISKAASRVRTVASTLTTLARRPERLNQEDMSINLILREVVEFLEYELKRSSVSLEMNLEEPLPLVRGSSTHLYQVFLNLLTNAIQSIQNKEGKIQVQTQFYPPSSIEVLIRDDGVGIFPQDLDHIFDPFFSTKTKGLGLGLSIVKQIILELGASIHVESQPLKGTTFKLIFPASGPLQRAPGEDKEKTEP